jgi:hypothetical protein
VETFSRGTLDPWYITGFADGEGSFTFSRSGNQIAIYFAIKLVATDEPLLEAVRAFFGVGKIYRVKARSPSQGAGNGGATKTASMYRVTRHDELPRVMAHFDEYPLQGEKRFGYAVWREMVVLKKLFRHGANREMLDDLAIKLSSLAPRNQPWR